MNPVPIGTGQGYAGPTGPGRALCSYLEQEKGSGAILVDSTDEEYAVASIGGMLGSESIDAKLCELAKADPKIEVRAAACHGLRCVYRSIGIETVLHVAKSEDVDDERGNLSPKHVALDSLESIVNKPNISMAHGAVNEVVNQAVRFLRTRSP